MTKTITIGSRQVPGDGVFFVVEENNVSLGDLNRAREIVDAAKVAGADAVEFQFAVAADFIVSTHERYDVWRNLQLPLERMCELVGCVREAGLEPVVTSLSHNLVEPLVDAGVSAFNINASDIDNPQMLECVANSGRPFFISTALATEDEICWAVDRVKERSDQYILLHGQHPMGSGRHGVDPEHTCLGYLQALKERFNTIVGFIDHTPHVWMPASAVAAGASVVTKHLCVSRDEKRADWQICLEPEALRDAVSNARAIAESIGVKIKKLAPGENIDKSYMRRSIVAARDIGKAERISAEDVSFKRPGDGMSPKLVDLVVGKAASRDIAYDEQLTSDSVH